MNSYAAACSKDWRPVATSPDRCRDSNTACWNSTTCYGKRFRKRATRTPPQDSCRPGPRTEMRQQNRNRATELRERGAHRPILDEVIASRREPCLRRLGELGLLGNPGIEPLAHGVALRDMRCTLAALRNPRGA